jgi:hypothetical protein
MELVVNHGEEQTAATPGGDGGQAVRRAPAPRRGGPLALLRFMRSKHMLSPSYAVLLARYAFLKLRFGRRLQTDGICFICPGVKLEIGRNATLRIGRWAWIGHGCKIRVHEGESARSARSRRSSTCRSDASASSPIASC